MKFMMVLILVFLNSLASNSYAQKTKELVLYNWKDYTDKSVIEDFEKKTGIKVILREYETVDMMLSEVQSDPASFDVIVATDVSASLLIQSKLLTELDLNKIPNRKYIKKQFRGFAMDPVNKYSLTGIFWYATGLVINTNFVSEDVDAWAGLWEKKYQGKIALLDDCRDAMAAVLKYSRLSLNSDNPQELELAEKNAGLLRDNRVKFGDTLGNLEKVMRGELWISQVYSGDAALKSKESKDIKFIFPQEGFNLGTDIYVISVDSKHVAEAHQLINFFLEPQNAARAATTFFYPTTVEAEQLLSKEFLNNPVIYPPQSILKKGEHFRDLGAKENEYVRIFNLMKSGAN